MYSDLQSFVAALQAAGELRVIDEPTAPLLAITAQNEAETMKPAASMPGPSARRTDPRFFDKGGQALLFRNVQGVRLSAAHQRMGQLCPHGDGDGPVAGSGGRSIQSSRALGL
jgi:3-polyprenyl-4-hydroxybenzoate decarboxylase